MLKEIKPQNPTYHHHLQDRKEELPQNQEIAVEVVLQLLEELPPFEGEEDHLTLCTESEAGEDILLSPSPTPHQHQQEEITFQGLSTTHQMSGDGLVNPTER